MRSRWIKLTLGLYLSLVLIACSNKTPESTDTNQPGTSTTGTNKTQPAKAKAEAPTVVVPAGTVLTVRLGQAVGSKISTPGQTFVATLASPVTVGGNTVIPAKPGSSQQSRVVADTRQRMTSHGHSGRWRQAGSAWSVSASSSRDLPALIGSRNGTGTPVAAIP